MALTTIEAQKLLNKKRKNSDVVFNEDYKSDKEKHKFICKKCHHIWTSTPNILKRKDNIGCPNCHKFKLIEKKKKKEFSKVRGATKLLNNPTLAISDLNIPHGEPIQLSRIKTRISDTQQEIKNREPEFNRLKNIHIVDKEKLNEFLNTKKHFGWFWAIVLFPIWVWYQLNFSEQLKPYKDKEQYSFKKLSVERDSVRQLDWILKDLKSNYKSLEKRIKYKRNLNRLKNRINIKFGSKTRLYYFRMRFKGKKYYKIGITTNSVESRYRNSDGSKYRAIEEIFFDAYIYDSKRIEQLILHVFKDKLANNKRILAVKGGYSEVFVSDVLDLDSEASENVKAGEEYINSVYPKPIVSNQYYSPTVPTLKKKEFDFSKQIDLLNSAINKKEKIKFKYKRPAQKKYYPLEFFPQKIHSISFEDENDESLYVLGICQNGREINFELKRMKKIEKLSGEYGFVTSN